MSDVAFDRMARLADRIATRIDTSPVRTIRQDDDWWSGFCAELWNEYQQAQVLAAPVCMLAKYFPFLFAACGAMEGGAMVLLLAYLYECQQYH